MEMRTCIFLGLVGLASLLSDMPEASGQTVSGEFVLNPNISPDLTTVGITTASSLSLSAWSVLPTCALRGECCPTGSKDNDDKYRGDEQCSSSSSATPGDRMPLSCALPSKWCNCTSQAWVVAPWQVKSLPGGYLDKSHGQAQALTNPQPYVDGVFTRDKCCQACSAANSGTNSTGGKNFFCAYWMHYVPTSSSLPGCAAGCGDSSKCGYCIIFPPGAPAPTCTPSTTPTCRDEYPSGIPQGRCAWRAATYATVGKGCPGGKNDPHFVGARGTHFDFNGVPDQSFCLVTDAPFQVNMKMRGYYDSRTIGASILRNGKAVRTWIKDLAFLWTDPTAPRPLRLSERGALAQHSLLLSARSGKAQERGLGFLGGIVVDGAPMPRLKLGESLSGPGGLRVSLVGYEKDGGGYFDVDVYEVVLPGMMSVELKLRVAHPLLQTREDAMAHLNVRFLFLNHSSTTHGVLGQTFRPGRQQRSMDYTALAALLGRDIAADSDLGSGFLDGTPLDYRTSSVLAPDCRFSAFNGRVLPALK